MTRRTLSTANTTSGHTEFGRITTLFDLIRELGDAGERLRGVKLAYGKGCDECFHTGYRDRTAIHEIMRLDRGLRDAIGRKAATAEVRRLAVSSGMRTLRLAGLERVAAGVTTVDEVIRETMM